MSERQAGLSRHQDRSLIVRGRNGSYSGATSEGGGSVRFACAATFLRVERVTGIEPALSAWETFLHACSVLRGAHATWSLMIGVDPGLLHADCTPVALPARRPPAARGPRGRPPMEGLGGHPQWRQHRRARRLAGIPAEGARSVSEAHHVTLFLGEQRAGRWLARGCRCRVRRARPGHRLPPHWREQRRASRSRPRHHHWGSRPCDCRCRRGRQL